jgi:probable phosphoglycerate mutase
MRLVLVRHGETEHNRGRVTLGRADVPLNELGRQQAQAVAGAVARFAPDAVYSSPLSRALDTAKAVGVACGVEVTVEPALIEMDVGELEHLTGAELRERHPAFLQLWLGEGGAEARMPGGESLREVQERAGAAVDRIAQARADGTVVLVTHNFVILALLCRALDLPLSRFRRLRHEVAAVSVVDMRGPAPALILLNDRSHLAAAGLLGEAAEREARA